MGFPQPMPCPDCGMIPPTYMIGAISHKPVVGCMNICCENFTQFEGSSLGEAIGKWDAYCINRNRSERK